MRSTRSACGAPGATYRARLRRRLAVLRLAPSPLTGQYPAPDRRAHQHPERPGRHGRSAASRAFVPLRQPAAQLQRGPAGARLHAPASSASSSTGTRWTVDGVLRPPPVGARLDDWQRDLRRRLQRVGLHQHLPRPGRSRAAAEPPEAAALRAGGQTRPGLRHHASPPGPGARLPPRSSDRRRAVLPRDRDLRSAQPHARTAYPATHCSRRVPRSAPAGIRRRQLRAGSAATGSLPTGWPDSETTTRRQRPRKDADRHAGAGLEHRRDLVGRRR